MKALILGLVLVAAVAFAADEGESLFLRHCAECHGFEGRGDGPLAKLFERPSADLRRADLWKRYGDEELLRFVREGKRLRLEVRPQALRDQSRRTETLYRFLIRIPEMDWVAVENGEALYLDRCVACHDPHGKPRRALPAGVRPPRDLSSPAWQGSIDDEELIARIRHGRRGMPALVPPLSGEEARTLLPYVRVLSPGFRLYDRHCLSCHGPRGEGATGALEEFPAPRFAFDREYFTRRDPEEVRSSIWHMLREENRWMPHFAGVLSEEDVRTVVRYLRSLPPPKP